MTLVPFGQDKGIGGRRKCGEEEEEVRIAMVCRREVRRVMWWVRRGEASVRVRLEGVDEEVER